MTFRTVLIFCFLFAYNLKGEEPISSKNIEEVDDFSKLIDFDGLPSTVIAGSVNVITGNYFESEDDLVSFGTNPITISRYYNSGSTEIGDLSDAWDLNLSSMIKVTHSKDGSYARVMDRGMEIPFRGKKHSPVLKVLPKVLDAGVVNICSAYLSGRSHILNKEITMFKDGERKWFSLKTPGGETQHFGKKKTSEKYLLSEITQPNGCNLRYGYDKGKVGEITAFGRRGESMGRAWIERSKRGKSSELSVECEDGNKVVYNITRMGSKHGNGSHRHYLTSVEKNFAPSIKYHYKSCGNRKRENLIKKEYPDNRFLEIHYYSGSKKKKVHSLYAPVGVDETPIMAYHFEYSKRKTSVYDALGNKRVFQSNEDNRLCRIDDYQKGKKYRSEKIKWGLKGTPEYTFLKSRIFSDAKDNVLLAKTYQYDSRGNILEERLSGNLSGASFIAPQVGEDGNLISNGCESHVKNYSFNESNLVITENDGLQTVNYLYYPHTALIRLKTVSDRSGIKIRYYYEYDTYGAVALEIIDDGNSTGINDLQGMTERRIKRVQTTRGLPCIITQAYLDLASRQEILIKKLVNTFTRQGLLEREEVYDCQSQFAFAREWKYDSMGKLQKKPTPLGRKVITPTMQMEIALANKVQM